MLNSGEQILFLTMKLSTSLLIALLLLSATTDAARILVLFPFPAKSHVGAYMPYIEELVDRGHQVTVVSAFPRKTPKANYTEILLEDTFHTKEQEEFSMFMIRDAYFVPMMMFFFHVCHQNCEKVLQQPNMQKLINSKDLKFDLVIYEPFFSECIYGIVHKFKAPSIQIFPNTIIPIMGNSVGNPSTVSYITDVMRDTDVTTFLGRLTNFLRLGFAYIFRQLYILPKMNALMRKYFPDPTTPSIEELEANTAFLFLHSHPILSQPRPLTPNTIEVAGLHLKGAKKLPQDLQKFLDDAPHGVIYFSLGSNLRSVDMPESMRNAILKTFSNLKLKVLWKWEDDILPGQPPNVRIGKWLPQHDILAHPNVKLFITHGGLMSLQEAIYFGVPLIAIPVLAEQKLNAIQAQNAGFAVVLEIEDITEVSFSTAIQEVLGNSWYQENVKLSSAVFRDQPQKPMDRAVFWTEYAIRHKGAPHLQSAALKLNFFQYYLLDVIAVLSAIGLILLLLLYLFVRTIFKCVCSKSSTSKSISQSKKKN